jgi:hypothetical protein
MQPTMTFSNTWMFSQHSLTVNNIHRFLVKLYSYNHHNSGYYPSSCLLFKTQLNSIGLSVPHRKHVTSPLRAQQVNAVYRFVTMVY